MECPGNNLCFLKVAETRFENGHDYSFSDTSLHTPKTIPEAKGLWSPTDDAKRSTNVCGRWLRSQEHMAHIGTGAAHPAPRCSFKPEAQIISSQFTLKK